MKKFFKKFIIGCLESFTGFSSVIGIWFGIENFKWIASATGWTSVVYFLMGVLSIALAAAMIVCIGNEYVSLQDKYKVACDKMKKAREVLENNDSK